LKKLFEKNAIIYFHSNKSTEGAANSAQHEVLEKKNPKGVAPSKIEGARHSSTA
jgi:hypothetical protein